MITIYNIRGTNGSGKSTLARAFIKGNPAAPPNRPGVEGSPIMVDLAAYPSPTKKDPERKRRVEGYGNPSSELDVLVVGSYRTACGGLDAVPDFDTTFRSLDRAVEIMRQHGTAPHRAIIAEGVLASTVWSSWHKYIRGLIRTNVALCYLDTPLEVCLERIRERQRAAGKEREIKRELVADKVRAIRATRRKAIAAGHLVYDLPYQEAQQALRQIMTDGWCEGSVHPGSRPRAREVYRARA